MISGQASRDRVVVVGSGFHFASGISQYTYRLSSALADEFPVGALLMRRLVPRRFYPGRDRVGAALASAVYPPSVAVYDGVDWYWGPSLTRALRYLDRQRPTVLVLQWWTGAVLHTYLRLARYAAQRGARIILEWHESQDVGEAALPGTRRYVRAVRGGTGYAKCGGNYGGAFMVLPARSVTSQRSPGVRSLPVASPERWKR